MRCEECDRRLIGKARGWRAYLLPPTEDRRVILYCFRCAVREFGPPGGYRRADTGSC